MNSRLPVILCVSMALAGCASSLSGIGGSESLSCKAPAGVICTSVSGVYANSGLVRGAPTGPATDKPIPYGANPVRLPIDVTTGRPSNAARSSPHVLRLWLAPWEDSDGDLNDETYVHLVIDRGRWLIEPLRASRPDRLNGVKPPVPAEPATAKPASSTAAPETLPLPGHPSGAAPANALGR